jgi:hypothetical protein
MPPLKSIVNGSPLGATNCPLTMGLARTTARPTMAELLTDLQAEALVRLNEGCFARNGEIRKHKVDAVFGNDPAFKRTPNVPQQTTRINAYAPYTEVLELERLGLITPSRGEHGRRLSNHGARAACCRFR